MAPTTLVFHHMGQAICLTHIASLFISHPLLVLAGKRRTFIYLFLIWNHFHCVIVFAHIYRDLKAQEFYWHATTSIHRQVAVCFPFWLYILPWIQFIKLCVLILQCLEHPEKLALCGLDPARLHRPDRLQDTTKAHLVNVLKVYTIAYSLFSW